MRGFLEFGEYGKTPGAILYDETPAQGDTTFEVKRRNKRCALLRSALARLEEAKGEFSCDDKGDKREGAKA